MMTRREVLGLLGSISAGTLLATPRKGVASVIAAEPNASPTQGDSTPPLAPGAPTSPARTALIDAFRRRSDGIDARFEARTHKSDWVMPYRLFRPQAAGKLPLVIYLHGGGGLGGDNVKQMGSGNIFGTRVWALPEHQQRFPCYIVAPQTDRGWVRYAPANPGDAESRVIPGLGDGTRVALELIGALRRELAIDEQRLYVVGQSMGGAGAWHMIAQRPHLFAAAVICCATGTSDSAAASIGTPVWNFHGDADETVPVRISRDRIAALRNAGGHPLHTEYMGVGHNVWQWAFTEPSLLPWMFSKRSSR
jgi:predicted peptidase